MCVKRDPLYNRQHGGGGGGGGGIAPPFPTVLIR